MTELEKLRKRQAEIAQRLAALNIEIGDGEETPEQRDEFDALDTESRDNETAMAPLARAEARAKRVEESRAKYGDVQVGSMGGKPEDIDLRTASRQTLVSQARKVLDDDEVAGHLEGRQKETITKILRQANGDTDGATIARHLIATSTAEYRSAFQKYITGKQMLTSPEEARAVERAMAVGAVGTGGYAVPVVIDPTIILTAQESPNDILRLARVEQITNGTWRGLSTAGMNWEFAAEAAQVADASPTIAQPTVQTYRADGFIPFSIETNMDWPGFASNMTTLIGEGYSELLANKLTVGAGGTEPNGLLTAIVAAGATLQVATSGALAAGDLYALWAALPIKYRQRAATAFMSSVSVENTIRQFGSTGIDPNFAVNLTQSSIPRLFGAEYPVNDYMPAKAVGVSTAVQVIVGDFKQYLVAQRMGMTVEYVPQLFGANGRPTGQRGFVAWARVGANVVNSAGFKALINK